MSHIQTQPQPGIVYLLGDLYQHLRPRLHHVLHRQHHALRHVRQQLPPEQHRLLHKPLRKVHQRDEAAVYHKARYPQRPRRFDGLAEAVQRRVPHQRVDGAGGQLGKRRVEP